jgi:hypothetical protein
MTVGFLRRLGAHVEFLSGTYVSIDMASYIFRLILVKRHVDTFVVGIRSERNGGFVAFLDNEGFAKVAISARRKLSMPAQMLVYSAGQYITSATYPWLSLLGLLSPR